MYFRIISNQNKTAFIVQESTYFYHHDNFRELDYQSRELSKIGSESYNRSLRRAFMRAKLIAFFHPELTQFITLTYKKNILKPDRVISDVKNMIKQHNRNSKKQLKYVYVMEQQKRGSIHVHMVASDALETVSHRKGYKSIKRWSHGFSDVKTIKDFDSNFRPYLYLFKYMSKAQRVGRSFIHTSKNFDKIEVLDYADYIHFFKGEDLVHKESHAFTIEKKQYRIDKNYYRTKT